MENNLADKINIPKSLNKLITDVNNNEDWCDDFEYICTTGDKCGSLMPTKIEKKLLRELKKEYPDLDLNHPKDDCHLGDIYSNLLKCGIEVKICQGWGKRNLTVWQNGTIQSHSKYFLFIRVHYKDNKIVLDYAYYGYMSYSDWTIHKVGKDKYGNQKYRGMNIGIKKIKQFCKKII